MLNAALPTAAKLLGRFEHRVVTKCFVIFVLLHQKLSLLIYEPLVQPAYHGLLENAVETVRRLRYYKVQIANSCY